MHVLESFRRATDNKKWKQGLYSGTRECIYSGYRLYWLNLPLGYSVTLSELVLAFCCIWIVW